jgi:hypothetical protein
LEEKIMNQPMRFEDLEGWQKARELTRDVYSLTRKGELARDFGLSSQIQRAAVSIMSNIALRPVGSCNQINKTVGGRPAP